MKQDNHVAALREALKRAQQDINWMLNSKQFLNGHVFDYIEEAISQPPAPERASNRTHVDSGALTMALNVLRRAGKEEIADALEATAVRATPAAPVAAKPAFNGWYCAHCERGVDCSEVTYHEQHTVCGRVITDDEPPVAAKPEQQAQAGEPEVVAQPLTEEEIAKAFKELLQTEDNSNSSIVVAFVRIVERLHGIGKDQA